MNGIKVKVGQWWR